VLVDESTTLSQKAMLIVVLKTFFGEPYPREAYVFNLDLIEPESIQMLRTLQKRY
jgi:hypothetical protein